jgi:hypothetical protein
VDLTGNLNAKGNALVGGTSYETTWQGQVSVSEGVLNGQGDWSNVYGSGIFSGTGTY